MSESLFGQALRAHVNADEPPLGLTAERILVDGRRSVRRRRIVGSASVAAAVAAILLGASALTPAGSDAVPADGAGGTPTLADGPSVSAQTLLSRCPEAVKSKPSTSKNMDAEARDAAVRWYTAAAGCQVATGMSAVFPQAGFTAPTVEFGESGAPKVLMTVTTSATVRGRLVGHRDLIELRPEDETGTAMVTAHSRLRIVIHRAESTRLAELVDQCAGSEPTSRPLCQVREGPGGETVLVYAGPDDSNVYGYTSSLGTTAIIIAGNTVILTAESIVAIAGADGALPSDQGLRLAIADGLFPVEQRVAALARPELRFF
ncbi:MAG: hypothetical protein HKP61_12525 [Dactylosporangium sp.]|nr:hypothetical protein [Dactylosporangium sp.]NNJ61745.1 hypothetical protein [Dactylosporangium sp.]